MHWDWFETIYRTIQDWAWWDWFRTIYGVVLVVLFFAYESAKNAQEHTEYGWSAEQMNALCTCLANWTGKDKEEVLDLVFELWCGLVLLSAMLFLP